MSTTSGNKNSISFYDSIGRHLTRPLTSHRVKHLNQRKLKTTLREVTPPVLEKQKNMTDRDAEQKMKMKAYADQKLGVREGKIKLEDTV